MRLRLILDILKDTLDSETYFHSMNLKRMVTDFIFLGNHRIKIKLQPELIREACLLHDIGKMHKTVKWYILTGEQLTREEVYTKITVVHTARGREQLEAVFREWGINFGRFVFNVINYHHDSWDRLCLNPHFLSDDERVACNIITAFDIIESLITFRRYRPNIFSLQEALIILGKTRLIQPPIYTSIMNYYSSHAWETDMCLL